MAKVKIQGNASGTGVLTVTAPNTSTDRTITLPDGTGTLIADNGSGKVGIGTNSPDGTAHIHTASAGSVTANTDSDDLVVENSGNGGISVLTPDASRSAIQFGHTSDNLQLQIRHDGATTLSQIISDDPVTFNVTDGSESIRVTADGITFQGDTAAANALDDYEEGTWTPTLGPGSGQSYASQVGTYTKVGNVVHCWVDLSLSAVGSITGSARILGLPFTPVSSPGIKPGSFICQNLNLPSGHKFTAGVYAANAFLYIWEEDVPPNGGVSQPGGESKFTNNSAMWGSFSYIAS